jgi:hypothetical protein
MTEDEEVVIMEEKRVERDGAVLTADMKRLVELSDEEVSAYTIPEGVTGIEDGAFRWCDDLEVITLAGSVTDVGRGAFTDTGELRAIAVAEGNNVYAARDGILFTKDMKTLVRYPPAKEGAGYAIPDSVTCIGEGAFAQCEYLESVSIPDSVTTIGDNVFFECQNLTEVTVPTGVTKIGDAFRGAAELRAIAVAEGSAAYATRDGVLFTKDMKTLVCYPPAKDDSAYTIPDGVTGVRESREGVFCLCENLAEVTVPGSMTKIGASVFRECEYLIGVTISDGVTGIEAGAFSGCENLVNLTIPPSVTDIGEEAFSGCKDLTAVVIPVGVTSIRKGAFEDCSKLATVTIPPSVTGIGDCAFYKCRNLTNIAIPSCVTTIGESAFEYCEKLTALIIPAGVTGIGKSAFNAERLRSITVTEGNAAYVSRDGVLFTKDMKTLVRYPRAKAGTAYEISDGVTAIGEGAFAHCKKLTGVIIPNSVTAIGDGAFESCEKLTGVIIPSGVASIGDEAFSGCGNLTDVVIPGSVTSIGDKAFSGVWRLRKITVTEGNTAYAARNGVLFTKDMKTLLKYPPAIKASEYAIPSGVAVIGDSAFHGCENLESIRIPDGVTAIGEDAFAYCEKLTDVVIPAGVTSLGDGTFWECSCMTKITIPDSVTSIEYTALGRHGERTIRAGEGSYAAEYARDNEIKFEAI